MVVRCLIDFAQPQALRGERLRLAFEQPARCLVAHEPGQVKPVLQQVHAAALAGAWCVGYLRYEAAPAFDPALPAHAAEGPLAWFGVFDRASPWPEADPEATAAATLDWAAPLSRPAFDAAFARIHQAIAEGELYQLNHTARLSGHWTGSARALFSALQRAQPGGYAACIDTGDEQVLSVSPELFFDWRGDHLLTRPMKGTAARGHTPETDAVNASALCASAKERAENVMIVDLLRNDLSRLALPHTVRVPRLFVPEALPTV